MASAPRPDVRPDFWPDLASFPPENGGSDARAVLLKINAEMFVAAPARDRELIETFEALALGFLPRMDRAALVEIARILAPCPDTPASVIDHLTRGAPETKDLLRRQDTQRTPFFRDRLLGTPDGRLQLAAQSAVDARTAGQLLVLYEEASDTALARNPGFASTTTGFAELVRRAKDRPDLARILLKRADLTTEQEAALFLMASRERRAHIRDRVEASLASRRATISFKLTEHDVSEFFAASRQGDVRWLETLLTSAFGFPASADWRILQIGRHPLLALALKALGLADREATRIFLTLHPALSHSLSGVAALARIVRDIPAPVALALVEAILGVQALSAGSPDER